eukprot:TRINITY_DN29670_c0_g1_i1.p1 TRINITY_DN29670_c0_g1~~TRINITY_DN29670_c0_g1_i1.p1  ORF type:complete len:139 (+),score=4.53 TRINITY_DN29670_c0_g1_i1:85-501(+)
MICGGRRRGRRKRLMNAGVAHSGTSMLCAAVLMAAAQRRTSGGLQTRPEGNGKAGRPALKPVISADETNVGKRRVVCGLLLQHELPAMRGLNREAVNQCQMCELRPETFAYKPLSSRQCTIIWTTASLARETMIMILV